MSEQLLLFPLEEPLSAEAKEPEYVLVFCPIDRLPVAYSVTGTKAMLKKLRKHHSADDQQYAFVIKGELGKIAKSQNKLIVSFTEDESQIPIKAKAKQLTDGWLGD